MSGLIFNEQSMLEGNIFKYEKRLKSSTNRFIEAGALLTTYYNIQDNAVTVDRGLQDIDQLFGHQSPLRFNKIKNFPVYGFDQANPNNTDDFNTEDINVEGDCIILPSTIVPNPNDFFIVNHLKMKAVFQITEVNYDSMKPEGYYRIRYRLHSTSDETLQNIEKQTIEIYDMDLNAIGTELNPVIREDEYTKRIQIQQMICQLIESYKSLFYNLRHNCFLYQDTQMGLRWFDLCGHEFISKYNIMSYNNSAHVIMLHKKVIEQQMDFYYNSSIFKWVELQCPLRLLQNFHYNLTWAEGYHDSSFARWGEGEIQVIQPLALHQVGIHNQEYSYFNHEQMEAFNQNIIEPTSEFDKLIWKYINRPNNLSYRDVSLYTTDSLLSSNRHKDIFLYTPIIIYIIRQILRMN